MLWGSHTHLVMEMIVSSALMICFSACSTERQRCTTAPHQHLDTPYVCVCMCVCVIRAISCAQRLIRAVHILQSSISTCVCVFVALERVLRIEHISPGLIACLTDARPRAAKTRPAR